eukprot:1138678-Pelagomonas_calceolata.AAC.5
MQRCVPTSFACVILHQHVTKLGCIKMYNFVSVLNFITFLKCKRVYAACACACVQVAAESLRVCEQVILVLRPRTGGTLAAVPGDLKDLVPKLFSALRGRLAAPDQEQTSRPGQSTATPSFDGPCTEWTKISTATFQSCISQLSIC